MAKWQCVKSWSSSMVPVGFIIEATKVGTSLLIQETARRASGKILFVKGEVIPETGNVWHWEKVNNLLSA